MGKTLNIKYIYKFIFKFVFLFTEFNLRALISMIILFSFQGRAEPLQDGFRYGTYGLVAGALAGGAMMAFSEDPGSSLQPMARGASLGLYVGLIVALYKNSAGVNDSKYDIFPVGLGDSETPTLGLAFVRRF